MNRTIAIAGCAIRAAQNHRCADQFGQILQRRVRGRAFGHACQGDRLQQQPRGKRHGPQGAQMSPDRFRCVSHGIGASRLRSPLAIAPFAAGCTARTREHSIALARCTSERLAYLCTGMR